MNTEAEFKNLLEDAAKSAGVELAQSSAELAIYMAERAAHLSTIAGEPGYADAVRREASNVAMRAGLEASDQARAADQRLFGMIAGALRIGAAALA